MFIFLENRFERTFICRSSTCSYTFIQYQEIIHNLVGFCNWNYELACIRTHFIRTRLRRTICAMKIGHYWNKIKISKPTSYRRRIVGNAKICVLCVNLSSVQFVFCLFVFLFFLYGKNEDRNGKQESLSDWILLRLFNSNSALQLPNGRQNFLTNKFPQSRKIKEGREKHRVLYLSTITAFV